MSEPNHSILVVGAGIAGCSAAYMLAKNASKFHRQLQICVADLKEPGSLTSSASTECFRSWWLDSVMITFVRRSIELFEQIDAESNHAFGMSRGGYLFFSGDQTFEDRYKSDSVLCETYGAGSSRVHGMLDLTKYERSQSVGALKYLDGIDVLTGLPAFFADKPDTIDTNGHLKAAYEENWPVVSGGLSTAKHVRNCGWLVVADYLRYINQKSVESGLVNFMNVSVDQVDLDGDSKAKVTFGNGELRHFDQIIFAVGPMLRNWFKPHPSYLQPESLTFLNLRIPMVKLILEIHAKVVISDPFKIVPRGAPLILFDDPVTLDWSTEQVEYFKSKPELEYLLKPFKGGVHFRPQGGENSTDLVGIWTYNLDVEENHQFPDYPHIDEYYGEIVIRGLAKFIPGLAVYVNPAQNPISSTNPFIKLVKAGYYCKTPENRPFIGPVWKDEQRVLLLGALSGFGIMTSPAAAELVVKYCINSCNQGGSNNIEEIPPYAQEFLISRYEDPAYLEKMEQNKGNHGQL